jgi:hypothetical protein
MQGMRFHIRIGSAVAAVAVAAGSMAATPGTAIAGGYGCSGTLVNTWPVRSAVPNTLSNIRLYYDASTGYNCAVNVKTAYYSQFKDETSITIMREDWTEDDNNRPGVTIDSDGGEFSSYAGPVKIPAKGRCVMIDAITYYYDEVARKYTGAVACG